MFKKMYHSLSMPVHIEYLVHEDYACIKTWIEAEDWEYETQPVWENTEKSLTVENEIPYMAFPTSASGVYHTKLPACRTSGGYAKGEDFLPNIPDNILDYDKYAAKLTGKKFRCISYAWIDGSDPSISGGEKSDGACWVIGVNHDGYASPAVNALAMSSATKAHPVRTIRHLQAPASLFMYQPFKTDKLTECSVTLKYNKIYGFSTNILTDWDTPGYEEHDNINFNYLPQLAEAMPKFTVTSGGGDIAADTNGAVEFKMVDADGTLIEKDASIYLEHTGGYLPKSRVDVEDGLGSFKVTALGLEADETFKVKIGFRNYTGITDVDFTVT